MFDFIFYVNNVNQILILKININNFLNCAMTNVLLEKRLYFIMSYDTSYRLYQLILSNGFSIDIISVNNFNNSPRRP